jgi:Spy/CpxP family protein refolding chaperone
MKRTGWKWLLAISLSLNLGIIVAVIASQVGVMPRSLPLAGPAPAQQLNLPDYLQLDAAQRQRWDQLEPDFLRDLGANWNDIRVQREALVRAVFAAQPDRAAIDTLQTRIAALQDSQQRRVITQLLAERALLNPQQREKLMALLLSHYTQESTEEELLHRR